MTNDKKIMKFNRKLQKMGNAKGITLPKDWLEAYELTNSKIIELYLQEDGSLIIQSNKSDTNAEQIN